ncbi:MAG: Type 1 glutamine amidotransferase-like domain-containing protein [Chloroflexi bacterium]|nr:Type 1 glutamine amidotransferase-like domain-containing protein [Chloroflexota bacterium]
MTGGPVLLVGGNEFLPGNEPHDLRFAAAAADGRTYLIAAAAARQDPDRAVRTASRWFGALGLEVEELPLRTRRQANDPKIAAAAAGGRAFYLCGGDPGLVVATLRDTAAWDAIVAAWRRGAAIAGSSAGAMALGQWTLLRARRPGDRDRRYAPALGLVPAVVVVPHLDEFGKSWLPSAADGRPDPDTIIVGIDARTAAVWWPGRGRGWSAMGIGAVEIVTPNARRRVAAGHRVTGLRRPNPIRRPGTSPR